ncbi:MAG: hypothetical protein HC905_15735 [Bacteroidales bacterium]|nr:hypothetical protein [Bacteroidales bacterium]
MRRHAGGCLLCLHGTAYTTRGFSGIYFLNTKWEEDSLKDAITYAVSLYPDRKLKMEEKNFIRIVNFAKRFEMLATQDQFTFIQKLTDTIPQFAGLFYALIHENDDKVNRTELIRLLKKLKFSNFREQMHFLLLQCRLLFLEGRLPEAWEILQNNNLEDLDMDDSQRLTFLTLQSQYYCQIGEKGKAILNWRKIVFDDDFRELWHDSYYDTMLALAGSYIEAGDTRACRNIFRFAGIWNTRILLDRYPLDFYCLRAEIFRLENNTRRAVQYYRKALEIDDDLNIRMRLKLLEMDLV